MKLNRAASSFALSKVIGEKKASRILENGTREKVIQERLDGVQMWVDFEIAARFHSTYRQVKKRGNFKTKILIGRIELFLYCLSS